MEQLMQGWVIGVLSGVTWTVAILLLAGAL